MVSLGTWRSSMDIEIKEFEFKLDSDFHKFFQENKSEIEQEINRTFYHVQNLLFLNTPEHFMKQLIEIIQKNLEKRSTAFFHIGSDFLTDAMRFYAVILSELLHKLIEYLDKDNNYEFVNSITECLMKNKSPEKQNMH